MARGRLILQALEDFEDREARPVWSWPERDKHSSAWLLSLPGPDFDLTATEFSEGFAAMLCQPSPACRSMVGRPVPGGERVCPWGDTVVNAKMKGDGFRKRHDAIKLRIHHLLRGARIPAQCEVFNEFADLIPQAALSRIERGRRRQGLVPDFKLRGVEGEGDLLCELKAMSASESRYPRNPRVRDGVRGVDGRADGLTAAYALKAWEVDWQYCGTPRPPKLRQGGQAPPRQIGPVETRLLTYGQVRGWCFGAWGEVSGEVNYLLQKIAQAKLEVGNTQPSGRRTYKTREAQLAGLVASTRRDLSHKAVQQQSKLLLDRLKLLGDGAKEAANRRGWAEEVERRGARERRAQDVCLRQGHSLMRHGFGLL